MIRVSCRWWLWHLKVSWWPISNWSAISNGLIFQQLKNISVTALIEYRVLLFISFFSASFLASNKCLDERPDSLQSLLVFLHDQSTSVSSLSSVTPSQVCDFIQHLRHFAQLGLLYQPAVFHVLAELHRAKDRDYLTSEQLTHAREHLQSISYLKAYDHLNLIDLDHFLHSLVVHGTCPFWYAGMASLEVTLM